MQNGALSELFESHLSSFREYYGKTAHGQEMEDIHQLRVAIKKIRSLLNLFKKTIKTEIIKKEYYSLIKEIFQSAGKVREIQINKELISEFDRDSIKPYYKYLQRSQRYFSKKLVERLEDFNRREFEQMTKKLTKEIKNYGNNEILSKSEDYLENNLNKLFKQLSKKELKLHKIRKVIRIINEIHKIIAKIDPENKYENINKDLKDKRDELGLWHDYIILIRSVESYIKRNQSKKDLTKLKKTLKNIIKMNEQRTRDISHKLKKISR